MPAEVFQFVVIGLLLTILAMLLRLDGRIAEILRELAPGEGATMRYKVNELGDASNKQAAADASTERTMTLILKAQTAMELQAQLNAAATAVASKGISMQMTNAAAEVIHAGQINHSNTHETVGRDKVGGDSTIGGNQTEVK